MTRAQTQQSLRQLPVKWALALLALIIAYALVQPALHSRLGWNLPSLASLLGEAQPKPSIEAPRPQPPTGPDDSSLEYESASETLRDKLDSRDQPPAAPKQNNSETPKPAQAQTPSKVTQPPAASTPVDGELLFGILKETGRERYVSPEGLQYNPGSEEGHRLKHLERHLKDIPNRPGKHGVFDGAMPDVLRLIDDAFARGKRGAEGVRKTQDRNRTIYEVPFSQRIGFVGGRDGNRDGNPPARRIRLVVEGNKFITAFPF